MTMTIKTTGTLTVRRRSGRFGAWSEAELKTPEGDFKVKDKVLDQYDEGEYEGEFLITQFFIKTHTTGNRSWSDLMAQVDEFFIERADEKPVPPKEEPGDPAEEEVAQQAAVPAPPAEPATDSAAAAGPTAEPEPDPDLRLFGDELHDLVSRLQPVRLDPSVGVVQFRQQRDRLHKLGYVFGSKLKTWFHGEVPGEAR
jgi:hypothetical protein